MHTLSLLWDGSWQMIVVGLVLGAGLPAVFALVVVAVALGIACIVASGFGKELSFENVHPTVVDKA